MFKTINDTRNNLGQMIQDGNDRFALKQLSWLEEYTKGSLGLILNFYDTAHTCEINCFLGAGSCNFGKMNPAISLVNNGDVFSLDKAYQGNDKPMFVDNVKFVQGPDAVIPSFVWTNLIPEYFNDRCSSFMYIAVLNFGKQISPIPSDREIDVLDTFSSFLNKRAGQMVKSGTKVMNNIAKNERYRGWERLGFIPNDIVHSVILD